METLSILAKKFPFEGYTEDGTGAYLNILRTVRKYLSAGSKILDFGSGPCDKTAVLQLSGYVCSAYDDLDDEWHQIPGNREKIQKFARAIGIDFCLADGSGLPFAKESFDMVMLHDVLEHLHDSPRDLMNSLLEFVRPEGYIFVTVPSAVQIKKRASVVLGATNLPPFERYYWYPGSWRGHVREYVRNDLVMLSRYLGIEIVELHTCDHMLHAVPRPLLPIYRILTFLFRGWKDSWLLVAKSLQAGRRSGPLMRAEWAAFWARATSTDTVRNPDSLYPLLLMTV